MIELTRLLYAFPTVIRADVIMNPLEMIWDAIGGRLVAIWIISAVITVVAAVTLLLLWLLKRKK
jgi:uncharacterized membrane protein